MRNVKQKVLGLSEVRKAQNLFVRYEALWSTMNKQNNHVLQANCQVIETGNGFLGISQPSLRDFSIESRVFPFLSVFLFLFEYGNMYLVCLVS